jgi:Fur family ferric uptake transcriptional regulator
MFSSEYDNTREINLIQAHSLRITSCRLAVLRLFLSCGVALSQPELEKELGSDFDRVTLYRTLSSFVDAGLLHKVPGDEGLLRYGLCHGCGAKVHHDEHIHFKCTQCGNTSCISSVKVPGIIAPKGFVFQEMSFLVQGICPACNKHY